MNIPFVNHRLSLASLFVTFATSRMNWIRFNRVLAWALILTPAVQLMLRFQWKDGLMLDFTLFIAHGILSLILFGIPKIKKKKFTLSMHVLGFRPRGMSARNNFLLTGYRLAMAMAAPALLFIPYLSWSFLLLLYPVLRMSISFIQHIFGAINYALLRWGVRDVDATFPVLIYLIVFFINLCK
ncbi:hypothetical protein [Undibacterium sp. TJN19]|uniref:hypothetical protein n=1 Tax=Undibacterium sp. TJN19 TaxID=3413055 RepID=UPI003BF3890C